MVTLKNKLRRMRTFNLDAPFFVKRRGETKYGRPETLTLLALERREGLPDAITSCTEIKAAIATSPPTLRVYPSAKPASEPKAEGKPPAVKPGPKPGSKKTPSRRLTE